MNINIMPFRWLKQLNFYGLSVITGIPEDTRLEQVHTYKHVYLLVQLQLIGKISNPQEHVYPLVKLIINADMLIWNMITLLVDI